MSWSTDKLGGKGDQPFVPASTTSESPSSSVSPDLKRASKNVRRKEGTLLPEQPRTSLPTRGPKRASAATRPFSAAQQRKAGAYVRDTKSTTEPTGSAMTDSTVAKTRIIKESLVVADNQKRITSESLKAQSCEGDGKENAGGIAQEAPVVDAPAERRRPDADDTILHVVQEEQLLLKKELCLYPLALLLVFVFIGVLIMLLGPKSTNQPLFGEKLALKACSSSSCFREATYLSNLLSWELDPCDDFYRFICHRWTNKFPVADRDYTVSADDDYAGVLEDRIYGLLQNQSHSTSVLEPMRGLFSQCMNTKEIEGAGLNDLLELMHNASLEGFPLTPPVRRSVSVWKIAADILKKTGAVPFLRVDVVAHPTENGKDIVALGPPETLGAIAGVDVNQAIHSYNAIVSATLRLLKKEFTPPVHTLNIVKFASEIEKLYNRRSDDRGFKVVNINTIPPLREFLKEIFVGAVSTVYVTSNTEVLINSPDFVDGLLNLVQNTESYTVMNFLGTRLLVQVSAFTPQSELVDVYSSLLHGKLRSAVPRWKLCIRLVEKALQPVFHLSSLVNLHLKTSTKEFAELVAETVQAFVVGVETMTYLNDASKNAIRNVVSKIDFKILGPSWLNSKALIDNYVQKLPSSTARKGLESYIAIHEFNFASRLSRGSSDRWSRSVFETNCWFDRTPRTVYIPLLLFNVSIPLEDDANPGQVSRVAARIQRCIFDLILSEANSTNLPEHWLNEGTAVKLKDTQRCLGEQEDLQNAARLRDISVTRFAYAQFERASSRRSERKYNLRLTDTRDVNAGQLFFVYLVLQSCEKVIAAGQRLAPWSGLVCNEALRHVPSFHEAFRCSSGDAMYAAQQCIL